MKVIKEVEIRFSLSVNRVVEVQENDIDIAGRSPSLVSLIGAWLRISISRLFRAKLRDVLCCFADGAVK